jgi:hypothetical protein
LPVSGIRRLLQHHGRIGRRYQAPPPPPPEKPPPPPPPPPDPELDSGATWLANPEEKPSKPLPKLPEAIA